MKKYLIILVLLLCISNAYSQSWVTINDSLPPTFVFNDTSFVRSVPSYSFILPGSPYIIDTLNIKNYSYAIDTTMGFGVLKFLTPKLDSTNSSFVSSLHQSNGDTLFALVNAILPSTNSQINYVNSLANSKGFKGLEVSLTYNTLYEGKVMVAYFRYYYNSKSNTIISFSVSGYQDDLTAIITNKNQFFNSIAFN